ncbi:hypothetical protein OPT61_g5171 [Boeremia exigua]|uniref:Uncharacterized protein n=1 Tax=Boeremia exigua TaxID=749465 RepID=A0ACC2IBE4_9PLEO|nr:hypothetical protein OPT61_g5171 [Boeremia exigua]
MGSKHSQHLKSSEDPYRALADQAASRLDAQYPNGTGAQQIAAAVPNGKEPLIVMFRKNEQGKYAYDQEYYDRWTDKRGKQHRRRGREEEGAAVVSGEASQQNDRNASAGVQADQGGKPVNASTEENGEQGVHRQAHNDVAEAQRAHHIGAAGGRGGHVKVDKARRAFVYRRH